MVGTLIVNKQQNEAERRQIDAAKKRLLNDLNSNFEEVLGGRKNLDPPTTGEPDRL